ncbi:MAG: hypothetical protein ABI068_14430 [Ktedonobacterales bacterium]
MEQETPPTDPPQPLNPASQPDQPQPAPPAYPVYPQPLTPNAALLTQATQPAHPFGPPAQSPMQPIPYGAQAAGVQMTPQPGPYTAYPGAQAPKAPPYPFGAAAVAAATTPRPAPLHSPAHPSVRLFDGALWLRGIALGIALSVLLIANMLLLPTLARLGGIVTGIDTVALDVVFFTFCFLVGAVVARQSGRVVTGALVGLIGRGIASIVQFALYVITIESQAQRTGLPTVSLIGYLLVASLYIPVRIAYDTGAATLGALVAARLSARSNAGRN